MENKNTKYQWRPYLSDDLEAPTKIAAIHSGKSVSEYVSEIIRTNLPKVEFQ